MQLKNQKGDTLIEVLVAVTVLSLVVTLCYTVMTRSFSYGQVALERNVTQNMVNGQISILRDIYSRQSEAVRSGNNGSVDDWNQVALRVIDDNGLLTGGNPLRPGAARTTVLNNANTACQRNSGAFYFGVDDDGILDTSPTSLPDITPPASPVRAATYPNYGDGMWIEGYRLQENNGGIYYDFYVKACWDAAIGNQRQSILTTVRFYEVI